MTQGELEKLPIPVGSAFSTLEARIMADIIRRIRMNGFSTVSADWQISRLRQLGESEESIRKWIMDVLEVSEEEVDKIFSDDVYEQYYGHKRAYEMAGIGQIPFEENLPLQLLIESVKQQTEETFHNITGSLGFVKQDPAGHLRPVSLSDFYRNTLDMAMYDIHSGAFDYQSVLNRTIETMTKSGLRWIDYESGWHNRVDVAARRAIMTGFRQVQGKMNEQMAEELGTDSYEVTYHVGARPTHQPWQGKVWTMQQLIEICGLGTGPGLHGWNCYHDYNPFIPGVSVRTYTDEQLDEMNAKENTAKSYNGKEYTTYEALQKQRRMETSMRATRQQIRLLEEGEADPDAVILKKAKYQGQMQAYKDFSKKMGLPEQMERVFQDGLKGKFMPTKAEQKILEESVVNDKIKAEIKAVGMKGEIELSPKEKIDVSGFAFDDIHINGERAHGVSREDAEQFVQEADISFTKWKGRFVNYYGPNGATFVDLENNNIRTAFRKEQFDERTRKMREVLRKKWKK